MRPARGYPEYDPSQDRDESGRWTDGGSTFEFVSPNVRSDLDLAGAVAAIDTDQHKALRAASRFINSELGIEANGYDIVGAWADGAENSVMDIAERGDWEKLVASAAMKGHLADQKSVLVFQTGEGKSALYSFQAKGELADIHNRMLQSGLAFHTLIPRSGGAHVFVLDLDLSLPLDNLEQAANGAEITVEYGRAEFIGTEKQDGSDREQRDDARRAYEARIAASRVQGVADIWKRVRDRWGEKALRGYPEFDPDQPRAEDGRWGGGSSKDDDEDDDPPLDDDGGEVDIHDDLTVTARADARQPVKSLDELYERSKAEEPEFKQEIEAVANDVGGKALFTPSQFAEPGTTLKMRANAQRKIDTDYDGDASKITDVMRATIVGDTVRSAREAAAKFIKRNRGRILEIKDRFARSADGYRDIMIKVKTKSGLIAEVQFNGDDMLAAKEGGGHEIYKQLQFSGADDGYRALLQQRMLSLYANAYLRDGNGNWGRRN